MTEPIKAQMRAIIPLLKGRITDRGPNHFTLFFGTEYGSPTTIKIIGPTDRYDLRDGDILTLYTEVLLATPHPAPSSN